MNVKKEKIKNVATMQAQTNRSIKKAAKRRNRNKRRRKLRQQRSLLVDGRSAPFPKKKIPSKSNENDSKKWEALCLETFQRLTTWQSEAELNFWKARTEYLQKENKLLKRQLVSIEQKADEDFIEEEDNVDPEYLEFIAITRKHREELRQARACNSARE